jgi:hypothetical protein
MTDLFETPELIPDEIQRNDDRIFIDIDDLYRELDEVDN